jgi:hypothetical protein
MKRGRIPEPLRSELVAEGAWLLEERLKTTITWRGFRAPGRRDSFRRQWMRGAVAVTATRLLVWANGKRVDVPLTDPRFEALEIKLEPPDRLLIAFDPSHFHDDWSGRIELRVRSDDAQRLVDTITSCGRAARALASRTA